METKDLFLVSKILGHSHTAITEIYAHLLSDHLDRARDAVSFPTSFSPVELEASRKWKVPPQNLGHDLAHPAPEAEKGRA